MNKVFFSKTPEDGYIQQMSLQEDEVLEKLKQKTINDVEGCKMLSDAVQVQFLRMLLKMLNAKKCIEVGSYTGYNVLSTALTLPDDGVVHALDITDKYLNYGKPYFDEAKVAHKIKIHIGEAKNSLDQLIAEGQEGTFDFVYIDADKMNYDLYYEKALVLLRKGGVVGLDNMLWGGRVYNPDLYKNPDDKEISEFFHVLTEKIHNDSRVDMSFLKIGDGIILCYKK